MILGVVRAEQIPGPEISLVTRYMSEKGRGGMRDTYSRECMNCVASTRKGKRSKKKKTEKNRKGEKGTITLERGGIDMQSSPNKTGKELFYFRSPDRPLGFLRQEDVGQKERYFCSGRSDDPLRYAKDGTCAAI